MGMGIGMSGTSIYMYFASETVSKGIFHVPVNVFRFSCVVCAFSIIKLQVESETDTEILNNVVYGSLLVC